MLPLLINFFLFFFFLKKVKDLFSPVALKCKMHLLVPLDCALDPQNLVFTALAIVPQKSLAFHAVAL